MFIKAIKMLAIAVLVVLSLCPLFAFEPPSSNDDYEELGMMNEMDQVENSNDTFSGTNDDELQRLIETNVNGIIGSVNNVLHLLKSIVMLVGDNVTNPLTVDFQPVVVKRLAEAGFGNNLRPQDRPQELWAGISTRQSDNREYFRIRKRFTLPEDAQMPYVYKVWNNVIPQELLNRAMVLSSKQHAVMKRLSGLRKCRNYILMNKLFLNATQYEEPVSQPLNTEPQKTG